MKPSATKKISKSSVGPASAAEEIIKKSGNTFHCKVASTLRERGWTTLLSAYYVDAATDKAREIDLIAENVYQFNGWDSSKAIAVRLYIECKYTADDVVFWFDKRDSERAVKALVRRGPYKENNSFTREHHYLSHANSLVAKLFASGKGGAENDPIYKALNQSLNGLIYNQRRPPASKGKLDVDKTLHYPVIVCSDFGRFHRTDVGGTAKPSTITDNFLLEVNYAYAIDGASRRDYFLIDVVELAQLDSFLKAVADDAEKAHIQLPGT
jgi:hypothetical protein